MILKLVGVLFLTVSALSPVSADDLGDFWIEVSRTVKEGDFTSYAATYHPDAVLVTGLENKSYPIADALAGWKQGFDDTASGKMKAGVEFRFTASLKGDSTAHQTGMFHYYSTGEDGKLASFYAHFEALLVKKGGWKMMMEYQKSSGSIEEWQAMGE